MTIASLPRPPRLLIFDVDGTLQDTFQWWPRVIRKGLARFAAVYDVAIPPPDDVAACAVVGFADAEVWAPLLPATHRDRWVELRELVLPLEEEELNGGRDYLFAGVRPLLAGLRRAGVAVALASNCRARYFAAVCDGQGLRALSDWQFCLDSPGVRTKADMVGQALAAAGVEPRAAVMIGDRESDQSAAVEHGVPFVWRVNDRCSLGDADGQWHGQAGELLGLLGLPANIVD